MSFKINVAPFFNETNYFFNFKKKILLKPLVYYNESAKNRQAKKEPYHISFWKKNKYLSLKCIDINIF